MRRSGSRSGRKEIEPVNEIIAVNIRTLREAKPWTQAQLAEAADIAERTIQRAEEGRGLSAETLQAVAGALDVSVDHLRFDAKEYMSEFLGVPRDEVTPELVAARIAAAEAKYWRIPLARITTSSDMRPVFEADALRFEAIALTEEAQDIAAELHQWLRDLLDIGDEMGPQQQREFLKSAFELVERLQRAGCTAAIGLHRHSLVRRGGGESMPCTTLYALVGSNDDVPEFVAVEKGQPFRIA
jgi:transcriptional regulator with XRE-family HTH domain